jgi:hypothetical protein
MKNISKTKGRRKIAKFKLKIILNNNKIISRKMKNRIVIASTLDAVVTIPAESKNS